MIKYISYCNRLKFYFQKKSRKYAFLKSVPYSDQSDVLKNFSSNEGTHLQNEQMMMTQNNEEKTKRRKNLRMHFANVKEEDKENLLKHNLNDHTMKVLQSEKISYPPVGRTRPSSPLQLQGNAPPSVPNVAVRRMDDEDDSQERLVSQVQAVSVLNKVRMLQNEIREINKEIKAEDSKIKEKETELKSLKKDISNEGEASEEDIMETLREIKLKKEDAKMKAIETQIKVKQAQEKNTDNEVLERALGMISVRRKLIQEAILQQRKKMLEKQRLAAAALLNKKEMDIERGNVLKQLKQQRREKAKQKRLEKIRELEAAIDSQNKAIEKASQIQEQELAAVAKEGMPNIPGMDAFLK